MAAVLVTGALLADTLLADTFLAAVTVLAVISRLQGRGGHALARGPGVRAKVPYAT
jgi:hypothetical protein